MVDVLWVPWIHLQVARHVKAAASGAALRASRAPRSASVFTPLSTGVSVMVMELLLVWFLVVVEVEVEVEVEVVGGGRSGFP
jgi:hypothetical protein